MNQAAFVSRFGPYAVQASKATGVDPRIILAQAAQETGWGKHYVGNNLFGIKSHGQTGGVTAGTHEYRNGQRVNESASFRGYESPEQSFRGYADFIRENPRYKEFMAAQSLADQAKALQSSGYATDPNYGKSVYDIAQGLDLTGIEGANDVTGNSLRQFAMTREQDADAVTQMMLQNSPLSSGEVTAPPPRAPEPMKGAFDMVPNVGSRDPSNAATYGVGGAPAGPNAPMQPELGFGGIEAGGTEALPGMPMSDVDQLAQYISPEEASFLGLGGEYGDDPYPNSFAEAGTPFLPDPASEEEQAWRREDIGKLLYQIGGGLSQLYAGGTPNMAAQGELWDKTMSSPELNEELYAQISAVDPMFGEMYRQGVEEDNNALMTAAVQGASSRSNQDTMTPYQAGQLDLATQRQQLAEAEFLAEQGEGSNATKAYTAVRNGMPLEQAAQTFGLDIDQVEQISDLTAPIGPGKETDKQRLVNAIKAANPKMSDYEAEIEALEWLQQTAPAVVAAEIEADAASNIAGNQVADARDMLQNARGVANNAASFEYRRDQLRDINDELMMSGLQTGGLASDIGKTLRYIKSIPQGEAFVEYMEDKLGIDVDKERSMDTNQKILAMQATQRWLANQGTITDGERKLAAQTTVNEDMSVMDRFRVINDLDMYDNVDRLYYEAMMGTDGLKEDGSNYNEWLKKEYAVKSSIASLGRANMIEKGSQQLNTMRDVVGRAVLAATDESGKLLDEDHPARQHANKLARVYKDLQDDMIDAGMINSDGSPLESEGLVPTMYSRDAGRILHEAIPETSWSIAKGGVPQLYKVFKVKGEPGLFRVENGQVIEHNPQSGDDR